MKVRTTYGIANIYLRSSPRAIGRVLVMPGFGESIYHVKPVVDALANEGYEALTFSPPRRDVKRAGKRIDPMVRQAEIVLEILEAMALPATLAGKKVHAVAHSLGAGAALKVAQLQPEYFASLVLMQPVGLLSENQSVYELAKRATKKIASNQKVARLSDNDSTARVAKTRFVSWAVIARQPLLALREAAAAGNYSMAEDAQKVADLGIPTHVVAAKGDEMFDHAKVERSRSTIEGIVQSYALLDGPTANHDTFWIHPQNTAAIVARLIRNEPKN